MKSIFGASLFGAAVVLCISNVHVIAEGFDCNLDIRIPDSVMQMCPELDKGDGIGMGSYVTDAVETVHELVYNKCNASVERLCDELPAIVVSSNVGGRAQCRDDLKDLVCEDQRNYFKGGLSYLCAYYEVLAKIISKPDKWDEDEKTDICALFKGNHILCFMATRRLCDRINSAFVKYHCQLTLEKGICGE